eukprot:scaffold62737_cov39-Phaeocystis_antarctica.AAC.1
MSAASVHQKRLQSPVRRGCRDNCKLRAELRAHWRVHRQRASARRRPSGRDIAAKDAPRRAIRLYQNLVYRASGGENTNVFVRAADRGLLGASKTL